jgi:hypothetical protein
MIQHIDHFQKPIEKKILANVETELQVARKKKLRRLILYVTLGSLCVLTALARQYTASAVYFLCLIIMDELRPLT